MDEPDAFIRWTIFIFAGGDGALFGACGLTAIVMLNFHRRGQNAIRPLIVGVVVTISLMLVVCGSLVTPGWFQLSILLWLILVVSQFRYRGSKVASSFGRTEQSKSFFDRMLFLACPSAGILTLLAIELPYHFGVVPTEPISMLFIIADSVTAGLNDGEDTWPRQLSRVANVEIRDASQPGATLQSARQQNALLSGRDGLLILEIGGNDLLESLPVAQFERDLDRLLIDVVQPGRSVIMFELPLPPLCAAYGMAQRRQAARHQVKLIPKRQFASVITTRGATVDGIHLSVRGQTKMMELISSLLGNSLAAGQGEYQHLDRH